jgi:hypothetical protein
MIPDGQPAMLVGFVNIHTPQAEMMMEYFERLRVHTESGSAPSLLWGEVGYERRQRFEMSHA